MRSGVMQEYLLKLEPRKDTIIMGFVRCKMVLMLKQVILIYNCTIQIIYIEYLSNHMEPHRTLPSCNPTQPNGA